MQLWCVQPSRPDCLMQQKEWPNGMGYLTQILTARKGNIELHSVDINAVVMVCFLNFLQYCKLLVSR